MLFFAGIAIGLIAGCYLGLLIAGLMAIARNNAPH